MGQGPSNDVRINDLEFVIYRNTNVMLKRRNCFEVLIVL